jgi:hypothetical protein
MLRLGMAVMSKLVVANVLGLLAPAVVLAAPLTGSPFETQKKIKLESRLDEIVFGQFQRKHLQPAALCSDAVFVRRVYLDVIGTLPTAKEARDFIEDATPRKRDVLIDELLARDEFADYWAMKWSDLLRLKAEFPINLWPNAAQAYHRWVRTAIRDNLPFDRFARELLTSSGSNFRVPQVNFYRAMQDREPNGVAQAVALTFMGVRADKWPKARLDAMGLFFSQIGSKSTSEWKEEILFYDPARTNASGKPFDLSRATFPDGKKPQLTPGKDPREVFVDWLVAPNNEWFTRNIANRVWSWLLGRGIIHEPDDIRPDNPPSNPELLAYLQKELIAAHYELKHLFRMILNSNVYQLSSIPRDKSAQGDACFSHYAVRRLEAEVLIDALCQITGSSETYTSAIPEPFTYIPKSVRSICLPDGSISSPFLELFGRPPRDTGLESERNNRPSAAQRLHLLNSSHVQAKLEQSALLQRVLRSKGSARDAVEEVYLTILSRQPLEQEWSTLSAYANSSNLKSREPLVDLAWALINSSEFLYRH